MPRQLSNRNGHSPIVNAKRLDTRTVPRVRIGKGFELDAPVRQTYKPRRDSAFAGRVKEAVVMTVRSMQLWATVGILAAGVGLVVEVRGQNPAPAGDEAPPVPKGVEVLARGPVHEAFATPTTEPMPTTPVPKKPPKPIEELPPEE